LVSSFKNILHDKEQNIFKLFGLTRNEGTGERRRAQEMYTLFW
jgi:hypothetical protein